MDASGSTNMTEKAAKPEEAKPAPEVPPASQSDAHAGQQPNVDPHLVYFRVSKHK